MSCPGVEWKEQPYVKHAVLKAEGGQMLQGPGSDLTRGHGVVNQATCQAPSPRDDGSCTSPTGKNGTAGAGRGQIAMVESILSKRWAQHRSLILEDVLTVSGLGGVLLSVLVLISERTEEGGD